MMPAIPKRNTFLGQRPEMADAERVYGSVLVLTPMPPLQAVYSLVTRAVSVRVVGETGGRMAWMAVTKVSKGKTIRKGRMKVMPVA